MYGLVAYGSAVDGAGCLGVGNVEGAVALADGVGVGFFAAVGDDVGAGDFVDAVVAVGVGLVVGVDVGEAVGAASALDIPPIPTTNPTAAAVAAKI